MIRRITSYMIELDRRVGDRICDLIEYLEKKMVERKAGKILREGFRTHMTRSEARKEWRRLKRYDRKHRLGFAALEDHHRAILNDIKQRTQQQ